MHNLKLFVTLNQISIIMAITFLNFTQAELNNFLADKRPLHKHMSLESALNSLNNQILWFANPTTWKDPFESRFVMAKYIKNGKEITYPWYNRIFCTCLTQTAASEAYWTPYSQQQIGVEFKINRQVLIKQLEEYSTNYEIFIGRVEYMMTKEIKGALSSIPFSPPITFLSIFHKRKLLHRRHPSSEKTRYNKSEHQVLFLMLFLPHHFSQHRRS